MPSQRSEKAWNWIGRADALVSLGSVLAAVAAGYWARLRSLPLRTSLGYGLGTFVVFMGLVVLTRFVRAFKAPAPTTSLRPGSSESGGPPRQADSLRAPSTPGAGSPEAPTDQRLEVERLTMHREEERTLRLRETADKETLAREVTALSLEVDARDRRIKELWWELRYGGEIPTLRSLEGFDAGSVRDRIEELLPRFDDAFRPLNELLVAFLLDLEADGEETLRWWFASFLQDRCLDKARRAMGALAETVQVGQDARARLVGAYMRYQHARTWLFRLGQLVGWPAHRLEDYETWRAADQAFAGELRSALARSALQDVRKYIVAIHVEPDPAPSGETLPHRDRVGGTRPQ